LGAEYNSLMMLKRLSIPYLQTPVTCDENLGAAVYDYIDGDEAFNSDCSDIQRMLSLLSLLETREVRDKFSDFNLASSACLSGADIEKQIGDRLKNLEAATDIYPELELFIRDSFVPALRNMLVWSKNKWPIEFSRKLSQNNLVLSPSDFGFHNAIKDDLGNLYFYDFEYFGWDDPVKLIADVSHHAAFELSEAQEQLWLDGCLKIYGESMLCRYRAAWPLYGLIWCLIILNEYNDSSWKKRIKASASLENERIQILRVQLKKAQRQLDKVLDKYEKI